MKHTLIKVAVVLAAFWAAPLAAQNVQNSDFTLGLINKTSPLALGGAYRALATDNATILLNPAGLLRNSGLTLAGEYLSSSRYANDTLSASIIDNRSEKGFAIGFGFDYNSQQIFNNDIELFYYTLAAAVPISEMFKVGASIRYYQSTIQRPQIEGPDGINGDIGVIADIAQYLSLAVTLHNLYEGDGNPNFPFQLAGSLVVRPDANSALLVDVVQDFSTPSGESVNLHFGGQYQISQEFLFRGGFGWDRIRDNPFMGVGFMVTAPRALFGFTYARHFDPGADSFALVLQLRAQ